MTEFGATGEPLGPSLSLIVPAYNEAARLDAGFARLHDAIRSGAISPATTQFVIVDDGSTDGTADCARSLYGDFPHHTVLSLPDNRGKGAAVRAGVATATGALIAFADADMAIDPVQTPIFVSSLERTDLAIGSRAAAGATVDRPSLHRSVMNRAFNHLVNTVTRVHLDDTQCGFKAFRGPAARLLFHCTTTERMAFDVELLTVARRLGLTITQVPVHWSRVEGSRVRSWSDSGSMVRDVLAARRRLAATPPVPAVRIILARGQLQDDGYLKAISLQLPVLRTGAMEILVLQPLMEAEAVAAQVDALTERYGAGGVQATTLSPAQLWSLAPLSLPWVDTATSPRPA